jgi:hypothetical protein
MIYATPMKKDILWCDLQHLIHFPNLCCWKKIYTSTKDHFVGDLNIPSSLQQENKDIQHTNLQAGLSTKQTIEYRENTSHKILEVFVSTFVG